jgi:hypothetical protein
MKAASLLGGEATQVAALTRRAFYALPASRHSVLHNPTVLR